jgi:hypothetical protein
LSNQTDRFIPFISFRECEDGKTFAKDEEVEEKCEEPPAKLARLEPLCIIIS